MRKDILNFKKITDKRGFMLVDGMVAVLIVAIGLAALAFMYTQSIKTRVGGERRQAAVQLAGQEMERLKKYDGDTKANLKANVYDTANGYFTQTGLGPTDYKIKSEIVETKEINETDAENATQKIEAIRVTDTWNDPQSASMILDGYILVSK